MALEVPQRIHERLVAVIDDLRNAVGQEVARAFLVSLTIVEPVEFEPEVASCDDSWMEFMNEDLMNDISEPSQSTPSLPSGKLEDLSFRTIGSQTEADTPCPAPSPHTANPVSPNTSTTSGSYENCRESEARQKRGRSDYDVLEAAVQGLPRSDLLDCLETYWQALTREGIYTMPSREVLIWTLEGSSEQARRLQCHLILRHLDIEDDLHQWRRSIAERRNLDGYNAFFTEAQAKQKVGMYIRQRGERSSSKAHTDYLAHIYADRTPNDYKRVKQGLQKDLRNGRRWSILIDGFVTDEGNSMPGLGLGFLLLCGPATARKM